MNGCESEKTAEVGPNRRDLPGQLRAIQWTLLALFGVAAISLAAGGYWRWRHEVEAIRRDEYHELKAIAELKAGQITAWRRERLADARFNSTRASLGAAVAEGSRALGGASWRSAVQEDVDSIRKYFGYDDVILAGADGRILLSLNPRLTVLETDAKELVARAISFQEAVFGDFFRCPTCNQVHLDVAAPILDEGNRPAGVLILRSDPEQHLYPLVQSWPTPSPTAETLLVRREGEEVLFLNKLRHVDEPTLTLRLPMARADVPAVRAALGQAGEIEGLDYRGVEVLADIRPVPGSPWFMVAKVDSHEILAAARYRGYVVLLFVGLSILVAGGRTGLTFNYRQRGLYRDLYHAERQRREAQEEVRTALYGIGDGVIATDAAGLITRMNPVAERLTGWSEAEAMGRPLEQVFCLINEDTRAEVENPVARVLREGTVIGLAHHSLLIARDGTERPIANSGAPIRDEKEEVTGVILVFRDQTQEREAQRALQVERQRIFDVLETLPAMICLLTADYHVGFANRSFRDKFGESHGHHCYEHRFGLTEPCSFCETYKVLKTGRPHHWQVTARDGSTVDVYDFPFTDVDGSPMILEMDMDITERKRAEEALRVSEEKYRRIFQAEPDALFLTELGPEGTVIDTNEAGLRVRLLAR